LFGAAAATLSAKSKEFFATANILIPSNNTSADAFFKNKGFTIFSLQMPGLMVISSISRIPLPVSHL
jgi:hypothetical protein